MTVYDQQFKSDPAKGVPSATPADDDVGFFGDTSDGGALKQAPLSDFPGGGGGGGTVLGAAAKTSLIEVGDPSSYAADEPLALTLLSGDHEVSSNQVTVPGRADARASFLMAGVDAGFSSSGGFLQFEWWDVDAADWAANGQAGISRPLTWTASNETQQTIAIVRVSSTVDKTYELRIRSLSNCNGIADPRSWARIEEVSAASTGSNVLWETELSAAAQTIDVPAGLLNNKNLRILINAVNDDAITASYYVYVNNASDVLDTTDANYLYHIDGSAGVNPPSSDEGDGPLIGKTDTGQSCATILDLTLANKLFYSYQWARSFAVADLQNIAGSVEYEETTPDKITLVRFHATQASGFGVGTRIQIIDPLKAQTGVPDLIAEDEELVPGTWWEDPDNLGDLYPVYRQKYDLGTLPNAAILDTAHGIANLIVRSVELEGAAYNATTSLPLPYCNENVNFIGALFLTGSNIRFVSNQNWSSFTGTATMTYSKTTDTPVTRAQAYGNGGGDAPPVGPDGAVQFNDDGSPGGIDGVKIVKSQNRLVTERLWAAQLLPDLNITDATYDYDVLDAYRLIKAEGSVDQIFDLDDTDITNWNGVFWRFANITENTVTVRPSSSRKIQGCGAAGNGVEIRGPGYFELHWDEVSDEFVVMNARGDVWVEGVVLHMVAEAQGAIGSTAVFSALDLTNRHAPYTRSSLSSTRAFSPPIGPWCYDFNGSSHSIDIPDSVDFDAIADADTDFTIFFRTRLDNLSASRAVVGQYVDGNNRINSFLFSNGGGRFQLVSGGTDYAMDAPASTYTASAWYNTAITGIGNGVSQRWDWHVGTGGTLASVANRNQTVFDTLAGDVNIGQRGDGTTADWFDGQMAEVLWAKSNIFDADGAGGNILVPADRPIQTYFSRRVA